MGEDARSPPESSGDHPSAMLQPRRRLTQGSGRIDRHHSRCLGSLTIAVSILLAAVMVRAQEDEGARGTAEPSAAQEAPPGVEVIQVRGRSAEAIDVDVTASVTQFDASTIQALGAQNIADLSRVTPNVNIVQPGATQATFFVRGVGLSDFSSNAAGAVTIFQDGVALDAPAIQTG